ncbi:MAG: peptidylprolyl isomerase [Deltaproteobacteria bacterium]|nr:peptidylprolyl isomerase [Deltaproteobacteria bacterium]
MTRIPLLLSAFALLFSGCAQAPKSDKKPTAKKPATTVKAKADPKAKVVKKPTKPKAPPRPTKIVPRPAQGPEFAGSHILIAYKGAQRAKKDITRTKEEALKLAKKVLAQAKKAPKRFAALAKKHSNGPSATKGGSLGVWRKGRMVPAFDKAIAALKEGEIAAEPVETPFGYHIMIRNALAPMMTGATLLVSYKGARRAKPTVTRTKDEAKKIVEGLAKELKKDPTAFAKLATEKSEGPGAKRGGLMRSWRQGAGMPDFEKVLLRLKIGQVSGAEESPWGFHVFKRLAIPPNYAGSHILIAYKGAQRARPHITRSKEEALKLAKDLAAQAAKSPTEFPQLALKNSDGPTARYGGDLGVWPKGQMVPVFDVTVEKLKVGEITAEPVESPFGYHVIKRNALPASPAEGK